MNRFLLIINETKHITNSQILFYCQLHSDMGTLNVKIWKFFTCLFPKSQKILNLDMWKMFLTKVVDKQSIHALIFSALESPSDKLQFYPKTSIIHLGEQNEAHCSLSYISRSTRGIGKKLSFSYSKYRIYYSNNQESAIGNQNFLKYLPYYTILM